MRSKALIIFLSLTFSIPAFADIESICFNLQRANLLSDRLKTGGPSINRTRVKKELENRLYQMNLDLLSAAPGQFEELTNLECIQQLTDRQAEILRQRNTSDMQNQIADMKDYDQNFLLRGKFWGNTIGGALLGTSTTMIFVNPPLGLVCLAVGGFIVILTDKESIADGLEGVPEAFQREAETKALNLTRIMMKQYENPQSK
jgi:hypothetical protein